MTHADLIQHGRRWLATPWRSAAPEGHGKCSLILSELVCACHSGEVPDVIGWYMGNAILIECKTSRDDFRADAKKFFRQFPEQGAGKQRYYLCTEGLLTVDDLPDQWGLLEVTPSGKITVTRASGVFASNRDTEVRLLLSVIRRGGGE
jgi:hypothetical protein